MNTNESLIKLYVLSAHDQLSGFCSLRGTSWYAAAYVTSYDLRFRHWRYNYVIQSDMIGNLPAIFQDNDLWLIQLQISACHLYHVMSVVQELKIFHCSSNGKLYKSINKTQKMDP